MINRRRKFLTMMTGGSSLDPILSAYLKAGEDNGYTLPDSDQIKKMNTFIVGAKEAGLWDSYYDRVNFYKNNGSREMALMDVKRPSLPLQTTATTWDKDTGFYTDIDFIDTKYAFDDSGNAIIPSHSISVWTADGFNGSGRWFGVRNDDSTNYLLFNRGTTLSTFNNFSSFTDSVSTSGLDFGRTLISTGNAGGSTQSFTIWTQANGLVMGANRPSVAQSVDDSQTLYLGGVNNKGVVQYRSTAPFGMFVVGDSLGSTITHADLFNEHSRLIDEFCTDI